ncbi:hypothetical protein BH09MYX1_BH09MYX1_42650 [soil metagenome]
MLIYGIATGLLLVALALVWRSTFRVPEGYIAVLTSFGAAIYGSEGKTKQLRFFPPGLNSKAPWHDVHLVAMMEQNLDLSGDRHGLTAMTEDGTVLRFDSILRFLPVKERLYEFLFGLRAPMEHITGLFSCLLRNEIANFKSQVGTADADTGSYALLRRERQKLHARIESFAKERIGEDYGVRFHAVDLTDILPPDELADALNAVINAHAAANAQFARAEAENQQRVLSAERGVAISREHALAAADEANELSGHLAKLHDAGVLDAYVARRRSEVYGEARSLFIRDKETT